MLKLPHKEERFMFVMYPLICLGGTFFFHDFIQRSVALGRASRLPTLVPCN
jgi:hypothetical protein